VEALEELVMGQMLAMVVVVVVVLDMVVAAEVMEPALDMVSTIMFSMQSSPSLWYRYSYVDCHQSMHILLP